MHRGVLIIPMKLGTSGTVNIEFPRLKMKFGERIEAIASNLCVVHPSTFSTSETDRLSNRSRRACSNALRIIQLHMYMYIPRMVL